MDKINIVNYLLTRRCNLKCNFCAIVKNYDNMPKEYPDIKHYYSNESSTKDIIEFLKKLKCHNPDSFVIWYGGEPLLRKDLPDIITFCNQEDINYTIISNNTDAVSDKITSLIDQVEYIQGFTASIDPTIMKKDIEYDDRNLKSMVGFQSLLKYKNKIKDLVAEITVTNNDIQYLYDLVKYLTNEGINSDITFVDISKSPYYDFSNVTDDSILVRKNYQVREIFNKIIDDKLNVHMKDTLLPMIYDILPSEMDCKIDENLHNICVDSDGSIRLCLRIRGVQTPDSIDIKNCFDKNGNVNEYLKFFISEDKRRYCLKCNHTCYLMSQIDNVNDLVHKDVRGDK